MPLPTAGLASVTASSPAAPRRQRHGSVYRAGNGDRWLPPAGDDVVDAPLTHIEGVCAETVAWEKISRATAFGN
ncbi:hypothetical protein [Streptomyces sp. NPDC004533]|uniref:hypothetical protein n=1 Tax=Streptomyces sp. NPDC004533 TaxID=3154278 RepID=UPI0033A55B09